MRLEAIRLDKGSWQENIDIAVEVLLRQFLEIDFFYLRPNSFIFIPVFWRLSLIISNYVNLFVFFITGYGQFWPIIPMSGSLYRASLDWVDISK